MSDRRLEDFAAVASAWFWETDAAGLFVYISESAEAILGRDQGQLIGKPRRISAANGSDNVFWGSYAELLERRLPFADFVYPYAHPELGRRWLKICGRPMFDDEGSFVGYRGVGADVTDEHETRAGIVEQARRFNAALENMSQGLCMFDAASRLVVVNSRYRAMFGLDEGAVHPGMTQREIVEQLVSRGCYQRGATVDQLCEGTRASLVTKDCVPVHRELADGRIIAATHRPMEGGGWVATFEDVTERRRSEARIAYMARHDALTDLPNRVALREADLAGGGRMAALCLDLDRFKAVNDAHGHAVGDSLLRAVADRLRANLRGADLTARLGGDEFAVLHRVDTEAFAVALAQRLIAALSAPYDLDGLAVQIGVSVGVALDDSGEGRVEPLLKSADMALYHAKLAGRGTVATFSPQMDETAQARIALERDLRGALSRMSFELHYQPLVDLASGEVKGLEALVRWRHPEHGLVSPAEFIPLAEETGLIVPLGEWIIAQACRDAATWPGDVGVAVNVSAVQLRTRNFAQVVLAALAASGLKPERLELEITETVLLDDTETNLETLHMLRRMGIRIAMDDFGTGYSSLSYLRRFPFDKIKIDRSFLRNALTADGGAIIRALVGLGTSLGITTLVEGVETHEQLTAVRAEGVEQVQGFLFSAPRPAAEIAALLGASAIARQAAAA